jgi:hypothetical protein
VEGIGTGLLGTLGTLGTSGALGTPALEVASATVVVAAAVADCTGSEETGGTEGVGTEETEEVAADVLASTKATPAVLPCAWTGSPPGPLNAVPGSPFAPETTPR